jgi:hypothetical protein
VGNCFESAWCCHVEVIVVRSEVDVPSASEEVV